MSDTDPERVARIPMSTGSPEGENSAYLLPDRGVLIDPGPPGDEAWDELVAGALEAGVALADVDHVLVTHWHIDHSGLAPRLADVAGATLHMHADDAPLVGDYAAARRRRVERDARRLRQWGAPESVVETVREGDAPSPMPESFPVETHEDGESVAGVELLHTPGHTLGHAAFALRGGDDPRLFAGDALLPMYTPNVGGSDTRVEGAVSTYLSTLDRLLALAPASAGGPRSGATATSTTESGESSRLAGRWTVLPGHGEGVAFPDRVEEIRDHHRERSDRAVEAVRALDPDPATPWAVAEHLFGEMNGIHAKMGAGEAAAHLSWLADGGPLARVEESGVVRYRIA